jgi:hypothetical protein
MDADDGAVDECVFEIGIPDSAWKNCSKMLV